MKLINVGFGNAVNADRVIAVVSTDSAPVKRTLLPDKRASGRKKRRVLPLSLQKRGACGLASRMEIPFTRTVSPKSV